MLTTVFATELATKNIRVNAIGPGFIETPMTASIRQSPEWVQTVMQMTPMQRFGQAHEIANTALFLASDESSYVSGQTLYPSGGMYTGWALRLPNRIIGAKAGGTAGMNEYNVLVVVEIAQGYLID